MAVTASVEANAGGVRNPQPKFRLLEDERWLAALLLLPTMTLLGLFIAYPFIKGIMLSVTSARVGIPGEFIGFANFSRLFSDSISISSSSIA